ncbi:MAG: hypothetical protein R3F65_21585 [bacterium]|nr:hypothetical protein [Myxococcales bacterium]MCB9552803.1 hypothetical protein [Myxococcales bacterium]
MNRTLPLLLALALPALAHAAPFRQGSFRPSLAIGGDSTGFGAGIGAAYCLVDGLEIEAQVFHWFGDPAYTQLSPGARYVFLGLDAVLPYVGAFYRRQFVHDDAYVDADFVGGRAGVFLPVGGRTFVGLGLGYERRLDCQLPDEDDCDGFFPELAVTLSL